MRLPWPWPSATGREFPSSIVSRYLSAYGSDPIAPQNRGPIPSGFGGHSRLLLLEVAARVLAAQRKKQKKAPAKNSVRHDVRQNVRRNKTKAWQSSRHHPNNQSQ